jgi:multidrug efflux pump
MSIKNKVVEKFKQFKPTSWVIDHVTVTYVATIAITLWGLSIFTSLPKESFPDIVVPQIYVSTIYAGTSPKDMENLVTRPIEKEIKAITGARIRKVASTSIQDYSSILVEFETDVEVDIAKQKVKDAVDKARSELPVDLTEEPNITEVSFSDMPIMFVNVSGNYDQLTLKRYAEDLQDRFEELREVNKADIAGAPEREIQVNVDKYKMESAGITFTDIENAIKAENVDVSAGNIKLEITQPTLQVKGQFKSAFDMQNIVIRNIYGQSIYMKDIAQIIDTVKEKESYSRINGQDVITLQIVKRAGENLINTSDQVKAIIAEMKQTGEIPPSLDVTITGDQSVATRTSFKELINTIVIGFILVTIVLMFFMGVSNAFFVALSVPLSVFIAFMFLPLADVIIGTNVTLNFIVLFALLFGLGIIVDDAIVVIENTHRIFNNGRVPIVKAAKEAAGEVWAPVLSGTVTTLAPFFPLLFWPGLIGKFMIYLPTVLILTLAASLIVAFFINPVFAVSFMRPEHYPGIEPRSALFRKKYFWVFVGFGVLFHLLQLPGLGNFILLLVLLMILNRYLLNDIIHRFQKRALPRIMNAYERSLRWALGKNRPGWLLTSVFVFFIIVSMALYASLESGRTKRQFFPTGDPPIIYVYLKLPVGAKTEYTDSLTKLLEDRVFKVIGEKNPIVESVISNVAVGATDPFGGEQGTQPHLGRIQISFVEFEKRKGERTSKYLEQLRKEIKDLPGAEVTIAGQQGGPPSSAPVNIEVVGDDFDQIAATAVALKNYLDSVNVEGVQLKLDVDVTKPEIALTIDRERANREGLTTGQIGMELRTALFGREASKLKDGEDEYKIQIRYTDQLRNNITDLRNMRITYRDFNTGLVRQVPISNVVNFDYNSTLGGVKRKNLKRVITVYSSLPEELDPNTINATLGEAIAKFDRKPANVIIRQTGQQEEQQESLSFLATALVVALGMIFMILVLQFNSLSKPFIVLNEIFFSIIGVFFGFAVTGMKMPMIMVMLGVVGLAGIVVKNAILLIEFTDELRSRGMRTKEAIIQGGKVRIIPVLLTALATILGLLPLAVGLNINWVTLFQEFKPHLFFGGDSVVFWGPLSWTLIFGLIFAFFMTLLMVPSMYLISERLRRPMSKFYGTKWVALLGFAGPLFFILVLIMWIVRKIQGRPMLPRYLGFKKFRKA